MDLAITRKVSSMVYSWQRRLVATAAIFICLLSMASAQQKTGERKKESLESLIATLKDRKAKVPDRVKAAEALSGYDDELRLIAKNKDEKNLDIIGSNELLYWNNMAASGMETLRSITRGESMKQLDSRLHDIHQIDNGFYTDGFGDNP